MKLITKIVFALLFVTNIVYSQNYWGFGGTILKDHNDSLTLNKDLRINGDGFIRDSLQIVRGFLKFGLDADFPTIIKGENGIKFFRRPSSTPFFEFNEPSGTFYLRGDVNITDILSSDYSDLNYIDNDSIYTDKIVLNGYNLLSYMLLNNVDSVKFVSPKFANDNIPITFTSVQAAIDNSGAGTTIVIFPGTYNESLTLKNGITLDAYSKDVIIASSSTATILVNTTNTNTTIKGKATIINTNNAATSYCVSFSGSVNNCNLDIECSELKSTSTATNSYAVNVSGAFTNNVKIKCPKVTGYAGVINFNSGTDNAIIESDSVYATSPNFVNTPAVNIAGGSNYNLKIKYLGSNSTCLKSYGNDGNTQIYYEGNKIEAKNDSGHALLSGVATQNIKVNYLISNAWTTVYKDLGSGVLHLNFDSIYCNSNTTISGSAIDINGTGTVFLNGNVVRSKTGYGLWCRGGNTTADIKSIVTDTLNNTINISGTGVLRLLNSKVVSNYSFYPVSISNNNLILQNVILIASGSATETITAGSSQNIRLYNVFANKSLNSNVLPIVGSILIDPSVNF